MKKAISSIKVSEMISAVNSIPVKAVSWDRIPIGAIKELV